MEEYENLLNRAIDQLPPSKIPYKVRDHKDLKFLKLIQIYKVTELL